MSPRRSYSASASAALSEKLSSLQHNSREFIDLSNITSGDVAAESSNDKLNRYTNLSTFDHSRVRLTPNEENSNCDYISASFIDGRTQPRAYIVCQAPLKATVPHFFQMLVEQNVHTVVMMTGVRENEKPKCEQYWPRTLGGVLRMGTWALELVQELPHDHYTVRHFKLTHGSDDAHTITHFQYTLWPDDSPLINSAPLLRMRHAVRQHLSQTDQKAPLVVHCNTGVGRGATYVALDILLEMADAREPLRVFDVVSELRKQRYLMVENLDEYKAIFECLREALQGQLASANRSAGILSPPPTPSSPQRATTISTSSLLARSPAAAPTLLAALEEHSVPGVVHAVKARVDLV